MKRIIFWSLLGIAVLILAAAVTPFMVNLNKYREPILKQAQKYIQREIDFKDIRLTLLSGIGAELHDFHIKDDPAFSKADFASLDRVQIKVALLPLLKGNIQVTKIILKQPAITFVRSSEGVYNFSTLVLSQPENQKQKIEQEPDQNKKEAGTSALDNLLVQHLEIQDGRFTYLDRSSKDEKKSIHIENFDLQVQDLSIFKPVNFELQAALLDPTQQNFTLRGKIGPLKSDQKDSKVLPMELYAVLTKLPLSILLPQLPHQSSLSGIVDVSGNVNGILNIQDSFDMTLPGASTTNEDYICNLASDLVMDSQREHIEITSGAFKFGKDKGTFSGYMSKFKSHPAWSIKLSSPGLTPSAFMKALKAMLPSDLPKDLKLVGALSLDIYASGTSKDITIQTSADLSPMELRYADLFSKSQDIPLRITNKIMMKKPFIDISSLDCVLDQITLNGKGRIDTSTPQRRFRFNMSSNEIALSPLTSIVPLLSAYNPEGSFTIQTDLSGSDEKMQLDSTLTAKKLGFALSRENEANTSKLKPSILSAPPSGQIGNTEIILHATTQNKKLNLKGTLSAKKGTVMGIAIRNLNTAFKYADPKFTLSTLSVDTLDGNINSTAAFNTKTQEWSAHPQITNVQAGTMLNLLAPAKGAFTGRLTTSAELSGSAKDDILSALSATGTLALNQGKWNGVDLSATTLGQLLSIPGFSQITGIEKKNITKAGGTSFNDLNLAMRVKKGLLHVEGMQINGISSGADNDAGANLKGTFNLADRQLDLSGKFALPRRISDRLMEKTDALGNLLDNERRIVLPMAVTGTAQKPIAKVDILAIKNAVGSSLINKAMDSGLKRLQDKAGIPADTEAGKQVEQLLKGILR